MDPEKVELILSVLTLQRDNNLLSEREFKFADDLQKFNEDQGYLSDKQYECAKNLVLRVIKERKHL